MSGAPILRLERTFNACAQDVFDAWTNPEVLRRWWSIGPEWTTHPEIDLRPGGRYRLTMQREDGETHTVQGEYREVLAPERLVYTWAWANDDGASGYESTVTVHFRGEGATTTVVIEHAGLPDEGSRERHGAGWGACLDMLQSSVVAEIAQPS